jgi:four helix bundle protein
MESNVTIVSGKNNRLITNYESETGEDNYELQITNVKTDNVIQQKSFAFAIRIINAYKYLRSEKQGFVLSKQILRSGTSIGANVEEAIGGQSKADFLHKLSISYKEARETIYWLKLLQAINYLTDEVANSLLNDCNEICKIIGKIQTTLKARNS